MGGSENERPTLSWPWLCTKTLSQGKRESTRVSIIRLTVTEEQSQMCQEPARPLCPTTLTASMLGPKVRGLTGPCPTQLAAVSLNTSNKRPCGRPGKGAIAANRGCNTFHCPLGQEAEGWTAETVLKTTAKHTARLQDGTKRNPNLTLPLSSRDLWELAPAASPLSLPQASEQTLPSPPLNPSLSQGSRSKGKDRQKQPVLSPRLEGNPDGEVAGKKRVAAGRVSAGQQPIPGGAQGAREQEPSQACIAPGCSERPYLQN